MSLAGRRRPAPARPDTGVGVLDRVVAILDAVEGGARTFTDLVEATGFARSTTHRLINGLVDHGFLTSVGGFGYRLGPRLLELATVAMRDLPLRDIARPALERLAEASGESAQLFVRVGDRRVCVEAVESLSELRTIVQVGASLPLTAGSAGKVFLAWAAEDDVRRVLRRPERYTARTITDRDRLRTQIDAAGRRGWAESAEEREMGVASVSAPVVNRAGRLVAVVSVSGPIQRTGRRPGKRYAPEVLAAARAIESALGL